MQQASVEYVFSNGEDNFHLDITKAVPAQDALFPWLRVINTSLPTREHYLGSLLVAQDSPPQCQGEWSSRCGNNPGPTQLTWAPLFTLRPKLPLLCVRVGEEEQRNRTIMTLWLGG